MLCLSKALCPKILSQEQQAAQMWAKKSYSYANILPARLSQTVKLRVLNLSAHTTLCRAFCFMGFPGGSDSKCGRRRFDFWVNNIPCQPTPEFLPGKSHGQRRLADYSSWGRKKSDTTERLTHLLWFQNLDCPSMPAVSAWPTKTCCAASRAPPGTLHPEWLILDRGSWGSTSRLPGPGHPR